MAPTPSARGSAISTSAIFTDAATLKPAEPERFDAAFTAVTQPCPWPKAYGGDLVAQAAVAAQRTVDDGKALHSMHSYFMRPADIGAEVRYEVEMLRHVPGPVYLTVDGAPLPQQAVWIRPFDPLRAVDGLTSAQRDLAALAYVCDYTILEPVLRVLRLPWADDRLVTASLDHAMWFHRPGPVDGWLLYAQQAVAAGHGRGLALGRFFASDGTHLATVAQEGMIRVSPPSGGGTP